MKPRGKPAKPVAMQAVIGALEHVGPMTNQQLQRHTSRSQSVVASAVRTLHRRRIVHVANMVPSRPEGGAYARVYALGNKPDCVHPLWRGQS